MRLATITLTFGDRSENHVGMQVLGEGAAADWSCEELLQLYQSLADQRRKLSPTDIVFEVEYYDLAAPGQVLKADPAALLVLRNGLDTILGSGNRQSSNGTSRLGCELE